jgi:hypothetical protein
LSGVELLEYIPDQSYTVSIRGSLDLTILQAANARAIFQLSPAQKTEARLRGPIPSWAVKIAGTVDVWISFPQSFSQQQVLEHLKALNVDVLSAQLASARILSLRIAQNRVKEIAALPFVEYMQLAPAGDQLLNSNNRYASRATLLNATLADGGKGLKGEGVVIGIGDNADIQTHIDFAGRLINRSPMPVTSGHGTHVSGTAAGAGNKEDYYRGYAPKSTIVSQGFNGILLNAAAYVADHNMVLSNNSYGDNIECSYFGTYDLYSRWLDQMAFELPYLENFFASGNSGSTGCPPLQPFYHTVLGGYQSAKNVVTVGATTDTGFIAGFSSRGPVKDGRIKPEIVTHGQLVMSTWAGNGYGGNNGTSMACPAATGGAALLYQRYRQLNGNANPKNGLLKAILCNGASDRGNSGPDFQYGFGWMNLLRSVDMIETNRYFSAIATIGVTNTHTITVPANTTQLKVLLYWNDPAASPLTAKTLVNDLDLEVSNGSQTSLPKLLDTANANLGVTATEGADHLNNMEQVVINNPAAGNYTIRVKGTAINQNNNQEYFIAYDAIPVQFKITSPVGGETLAPSVNPYTVAKISWEAYGQPAGTVNIDFSSDNGANWSNLESNVDIQRILYTWYVPNISTTQGRIRITKNSTGETVISDRFTIMPQPVITLSNIQCEEYINIYWTVVPGATDYEVMLLRGDEMQPVGTTTTILYSMGGLSKDSVYWISVRPRINGIAGRRALAISWQPNNGGCNGTISDNDLKIDAIVAPKSGRKFSSTQLSAVSQVSVRIKNLDDAPVNNFEIKYSINGSPFVTETVTTPVAGGATYTHTFSSPVDLSTPGNYNVVAVVKNGSPDPVSVNDTAVAMIKHLDNQALNLSTAFTDNLETAANVSYEKDTLGLNGLPRYDFSRSTVYGRLRTFLNSGMANSGSKALILDMNRYDAPGNTNYLSGTFNLINYTAATNDLRLDFQYNNHGQLPHANNKVWIRGSDSQPWIEVYNLTAAQNEPGSYKKSESIELSDLLGANAQNFGTSFQVRWGQWGQFQATDRFNAGGYSFDDIRIYQVFNDLQLKSIDAPAPNSCGLTNASVVKISVRNSANTALTNVPVKYRVNNGAWISENISSIAGNTTVTFNFTTTADLAVLGNYTVQAIVDYAADSFHENDTLTTSIVNSPVVSSFPSLQNFELGTGSWYTDGKNKSWEYGTPFSAKIKGAASGARAWKTRLQGNYNDNELSYLYSPCYDLTGMSLPTLSFSVALDLEDCGSVLCDGAWVEYSADGITWTKLGTPGNGTNWYNQVPDRLWSVQNFTRWHVATIPLPVGLNRLRLRFVMSSDPAVNREGIAIDDIHIYNNTNGIYDGVTMTGPVSQLVSGNNWVDFTSGGKMVASVKANNQTLGATDVRAYINNAAVRFTSSQYYHDRNITIKPANSSLSDSVTVRFYFLEKEADTLLKATGCAACIKPTSAYELGISKYSDPDKSLENGSIGDNNQGIWTFINAADVAKVPFDKGYYAEFKVKDFSEFWLNSGGLDGSTPLPIKLMEFTAQKLANDALLKWKVGAETNVDRYEVELAKGNEGLQAGIWNKIGEVESLGNTTVTRSYQFTDTEAEKFGPRYYRVKTVNLDGSFVYSPVRSVVFGDAILSQVYPNASSGIFNLVYQLNNNESMTVRVMDAKGSLVKEYKKTGNGQAQKLRIDLTLQAGGVYLLELNLSGKKQVMKLYKQ